MQSVSRRHMYMMHRAISTVFIYTAKIGRVEQELWNVQTYAPQHGDLVSQNLATLVDDISLNVLHLAH